MWKYYENRSINSKISVPALLCTYILHYSQTFATFFHTHQVTLYHVISVIEGARKIFLKFLFQRSIFHFADHHRARRTKSSSRLKLWQDTVWKFHRWGIERRTSFMPVGGLVEDPWPGFVASVSLNRRWRTHVPALGDGFTASRRENVKPHSQTGSHLLLAKPCPLARTRPSIYFFFRPFSLPFLSRSSQIFRKSNKPVTRHLHTAM